MLPEPCAVANFWVWDVEVYPNLFLVGFQQIGGETRQFRITGELNKTVELREFWRELADRSAVACGFNNHDYDDHLLYAVLTGVEQNEALFNLSRSAIEDRTFGRSPFDPGDIAHPMVIDLRRTVGDQAGSLKEIGVKLDHEKLQELPFPYDLPLDAGQIEAIANYNINDLDITGKLLRNLAAAIAARIDLSTEYGDLLSARDSRIGEAILTSKLLPIRRTEADWRGLGSAIISDKIQFCDPVLVAQHTRMLNWPLTYRVELVEENGEQKKKLVAPRHGDEIKFAGVTYRLGMGGLHSVDEPGIFEANDSFGLIDCDVASFYPTLISTLGLSPRHINADQFQNAYGRLIEQRLVAKAAGQSALAAGLKIAVNSVFGKFSSPDSKLLFDPMLSAAVTLNGQLILLMLIETLSAVEGVQVLSANTDGIIIKAPHDCPGVRAAVEWIGKEFGLSFEYTAYRKYVLRAILVRVWVAGSGVLTKGDLAHLAAEIDESVGYFDRREKKRALESFIDWVVRDISPFPAPRTVEQVAEQALAWAQTKVERNRRKMRLQHKSVLDSTLVTSKALNDYLKTRNLQKFAASTAAKAIANVYQFDAAQLIAILQELIDLTRIFDNERSEIII